MARGAVSAETQEREIATTVPEPIERYFQLSLFLLLLTGFITLAGTGKLDPFSVVFVVVALGLRALQLARRRQFVIPERWTTLFTLLYILIYAVDYFLVSRDFVTATIHLVLFGMVVKVFSVHRDRDLLYLGVLSFLMVLAASVLTVNTVFLGGFALFLVVAIATFISFEMRRAAILSDTIQTFLSAQARLRPRSVRVGSALSRTATVLALFILLGASVLFFVLPRISGGYLGSYARGNDPVSGFRDTVQLGQIGRIQQSSQVVMHLQISGDHSTFDGKLRGAVLSRFDGHTWSDSPRYVHVMSSRVGHFDISDATFAADPYLARVASDRKTRAMPYRIIMEPTMSSILFLAKGTLELEGSFRQIGYDVSQSYNNLDGMHPTNTYWAVADVALPDAAQLRATEPVYPPEIAIRYLQLPAVDPRVRDLARQVTAGGGSPYDKARAVETYLQREYRYTLELPAQTPADPIADFLFNRREGHCEYFASSMAIMMRTLGIPTRVITGFRGGEYNDLTGSYIIRGSDAHAWVEVYVPQQGWVSFDPTASTPSSKPTIAGRLRLYVDAFNEFWHEWVVNYDFQHQRTLSTTFTAQSVQRGTSLREWLSTQYQRLLARARAGQRALTTSPRRQSNLVVLVLCLLVLLGMAPQLYKVLRSRFLASQTERDPEIAAALWYTRTTRHLARYGWRKSASQTPSEFVLTIDHTEIRRTVEEFTQHYEQARFGHSSASASRLPELFARVKAQKRARRDAQEMVK